MSLTEDALEEILAKHPILIEEGLTFLGRQVSVGRLRVDLLFKDRFGDTLIVELKRETIRREHVGQIMEYSRRTGPLGAEHFGDLGPEHLGELGLLVNFGDKLLVDFGDKSLVKRE